MTGPVAALRRNRAKHFYSKFSPVFNFVVYALATNRTSRRTFDRFGSPIVRSFVTHRT